MNFLTQKQFEIINDNKSLFSGNLFIPETKTMWLDLNEVKYSLHYCNYEPFEDGEFMNLNRSAAKFLTSLKTTPLVESRVYGVFSNRKEFISKVQMKYDPPATNVLFEPMTFELKDTSGEVIFKKIDKGLKVENLHQFIYLFESMVSVPFLNIYENVTTIDEMAKRYNSNKELFDHLFGSFIRNVDETYFQAEQFTLTITPIKE